MSTTPTELLETAQAHTIGIIGGADGPTAVFVTGPEGGLDIESIKSLLDGFDPASLLPDLSGLFGSLETLCRIAVMIGPLVLLQPGSRIIHLDLTYRKFVSSALMDYRESQGLHAIRSIKTTSVTIRLLLIILTSLYIYDRRGQFHRTVSVSSSCEPGHLLCHCSEI